MTDHQAHYGRTATGRRTWGRGGGTYYATVVRCACGWRKQVNQAPSAGGQKWAEELWQAHAAANPTPTPQAPPPTPMG